MTRDSNVLNTRGRLSIIEGVKTPLAFFVLTVLIGEGGLITFAVRAEGVDRTIGIVGMIVLLLVASAAVFFLASRWPYALNPSTSGSVFPESLSFDSLVGELSTTIEQLESNAFQRVKYYQDQGDLQRLLDGLYSGLLYATGAVPTGQIEPIFYGNLMEWDGARRLLRVRYFKGLYNDEIICRSFPLGGPKQGVASEAVSSKKIQYRNEMDDELKERGESLLKAMVSIPVPMENGQALESGMIVAINIDSIQAGVFPISKKSELNVLERRAQEIASLVCRVNKLRSILKT
jgi:hypothetical protein